MKALHLALAGTLFSLAAGPLSQSAHAATRPRLVVILVVDQLRADGLRPVYGRLLAPGTAKAPGGFRYLLERGAYWPLAEYDVAQCMTGPGHATIATGTYPYRHGIVSNSWWTGEAPRLEAGSPPPLVACVAPDAAAPELGESPSRLRAPTLGDALKESDARSRVVAVALKSRAAILLGGYGADLPLWFDGDALAWKSSAYYTRRLPLPASIVGLNTRLAQDPARAVAVPASDVEGLRSKALPQPLPRRAGVDDVVRVGGSAPLRGPGLYSPAAAALTVDAAIALLEDSTLALGQDDAPDVLAVSFSAHDLIAHTLGPQSPEVYASTLGEDRAISRLLHAVARRVPGGLGATLLALTADHGGPAVPEDAAAVGQPAKVIDTAKLQGELATHLDGRFPELRREHEALPWFAAMARSNLWLNPALVGPSSPRWAEVLAEAKRYVLTQWADVYADVSTSAERERGVWPQGLVGEQLRNMVQEPLSGHLVLVPRPGAFDEVAGDLVSHLTGYTYDRMVPMVLAGPGVRPGVRATHAEVVDLAPSLAFLLGILPPAAATGAVLHEAIDAAATPWTGPP